VTRLNKILIGALVVQLGLAVIVLTRNDQVKIAPMRPVLAGFDAAQVTRIQVFDKGADKPAIVVEKAAPALAPGATGAAPDASWTLASGFGHPVDAGKVADLLAKLAAMKSRGPLTTSPVRHSQLGVADTEFEKKLILTTGAGDVTLLVGNADAGRTTAVRLAGDARVYGETGLTAWGIDTSPARWIDGNYLVLPAEQISRISVQGPGGMTELERGASGWQLASLGQPVALPPGTQLDTAAIDKIVGEVGKLVIYAPADPKRDATTPTATISLWLAADDPAGATAVAAERMPDHVIDVIADGTDYWVHERGAPTAGLIGKPGLDAAVEITRDKLTKAGAGATSTVAPPGPGVAPGVARPHGPS